MTPDSRHKTRSVRRINDQLKPGCQLHITKRGTLVANIEVGVWHGKLSARTLFLPWDKPLPDEVMVYKRELADER